MGTGQTRPSHPHPPLISQPRESIAATTTQGSRERRGRRLSRVCRRVRGRNLAWCPSLTGHAPSTLLGLHRRGHGRSARPRCGRRRARPRRVFDHHEGARVQRRRRRRRTRRSVAWRWGRDGRPRRRGGVELVQLRGDGSLDPSFGSGGVARVALPGGRFSAAQLLRRQDGRLLVVGTVFPAARGSSFRASSSSG